MSFIWEYYYKIVRKFIDIKFYFFLQTESVEKLEEKMLAQENIISNVERRSEFSLYCVHMETQLVYAYVETMSAILHSLVALRVRSHSEVFRNFYFIC